MLFRSVAVIISVVMPNDAKAAQDCIDFIKAERPRLFIAVGGAAGALTKGADLVLDGSIASCSKELSEILNKA